MIYETVSYFYVIGYNNKKSHYRVIKLDRNVNKPGALSDVVSEDPCIYSHMEIVQMLNMIDEGIYHSIHIE